MAEEKALKPIRFPYKDLESAQADGFKKLGGPQGAFRYLIKGFKAIAWRKRYEANAKAMEQA
jgi:hypothetical protein